MSWQIAARMPGIFDAAIEAPTPEPQTRTRPLRVVAADRHADVAGGIGVVDAMRVRVDTEIDDLVARLPHGLDHRLPGA